MTIKNTKKNISDENGLVVTDINDFTLTISRKNNLNPPTETYYSTDENFSNNYKTVISFKDWENEDDWENREDGDNYNDDLSFQWNSDLQLYEKEMELPVSDIVRLAHLTKYYYNKTEVYTKEEVESLIKLHFYVWDSTTPPTVAQIKALVPNTIPSYDNYVFLVPFSPNYNNDNDNETYQDGIYREFVYVKKNNTESMEEVGSIQLDLKPYLKKADLDNKLYELSGNNTSYQKTEGNNPVAHYKKVVDQIDTNKTNITKKVDIRQSTANAFVVTDSNKDVTVKSKIGNIDSNGIVYSGSTAQKGKIITTDNSTGAIISSDYLTTSQIRTATSLSGQITATANTTTQDSINTSINTKLGLLNNKFSDYLLINDIGTQIWGGASNVNGTMAHKQASESDNNVKQYKLGDYVYYLLYGNNTDFYTKQEIDTLIGNVISLQNDTLGML